MKEQLEREANALKIGADALAGVAGGYSPEERQAAAETLYDLFNQKLREWQQADEATSTGS